MSPITWIALCAAIAGAPERAPSVSDALDPRTTGRVAVRVATTPASVRAGEPFSVEAEVVPRKGIHVYARGNRDYFPVTLSLEWPRDVKAEQPRYPTADPYIFGALEELVMVYQRPFRVTQRVTLPRRSAAARAGSITVAGVLRYQSCDDRVCFPIEAVPVRLVIPVGPADSAGDSTR